MMGKRYEYKAKQTNSKKAKCLPIFKKNDSFMKKEESKKKRSR